MKKLLSICLFAALLLSCSEQTRQTLENAEPQVSRVEPLSWWTDMQMPLTLMFYGQDLQDARVTVEKLDNLGTNLETGEPILGEPHRTTGLKIRGQHNAENKNYLFVDVEVREAGDYLFTLSQGDKSDSWVYHIDKRREGSRNRQSFTSADVIYLIMSDRFVDGDPSNNSTDNTIEKADKQNLDGRWGGDIQGIINSLDHIAELGATAIWPTPLLLDNEPSWSYHGYACGDYYHIDPRFGTNEQYREMVAKAHEKGLKVLMDIVTNHSGLGHWWYNDLPYQDWIHQFPEFTNSINVFTTNYDPNASEYDRKLHENGWFDTHMPDMNLDNPDLLKYFQQFAIWWVEYADLDGLRVDTYPYNEKEPMSEWCKAVRNEYPNINIVGECWTRPATNIAYWQAGARNADGFNSNLPSVMDFPTEEAIRQALENDGNFWGGGLTRVYDAISQDFLYADVNKLLVFVGNHDMDHIADVVKDCDPRRVKLAITLIATIRGIPQLFAGDEYAMRSADMSRGHSGLRQPLPQRDTLTAAQKDMFDFHKRLFQFRKTEPVLHNGKTMHFCTRDNTYAFFRYNDDEAVFVFLNAAEQPRLIPADHYDEILSHYQLVGTDAISGETVDLSQPVTVAPLSSLVVKLARK